MPVWGSWSRTDPGHSLFFDPLKVELCKSYRSKNYMGLPGICWDRSLDWVEGSLSWWPAKPPFESCFRNLKTVHIANCTNASSYSTPSTFPWNRRYSRPNAGSGLSKWWSCRFLYMASFYMGHNWLFLLLKLHTLFSYSHLHSGDRRAVPRSQHRICWERLFFHGVKLLLYILHFAHM